MNTLPESDSPPDPRHGAPPVDVGETIATNGSTPGDRIDARVPRDISEGPGPDLPEVFRRRFLTLRAALDELRDAYRPDTTPAAAAEALMG